MRVLLIHANPFQRVLPVPPYGLERIRSAALETGAEIKILDPYLVSSRPHELAAEVAGRFEPDVVGLGLRVIDDSVVIERLEAPSAEPTDITWLLPEVRELREKLRDVVPDALLVVGGATFSYLPLEVLAYLDVEWGVVGPGEASFRELLREHDGGRPLHGIRGVVHRGGPRPLLDPAASPVAVVKREGLYAPTSCFPVRTRIGCAMKCSYCLTSALGGVQHPGDVDSILDEIEGLVGHAQEHGLTRVPLFFADDEFNLPTEEHALEILEGIVARNLASRIQWRAYLNPVPFSARLARLIARTGGHASITVDTASETVMARNRKPFRLRHLRRSLARVIEHGVSADLTFLFGLPGEDERTIQETVAFLRRLPPEIAAGYGVGARVYPNTPLAEEATLRPDLAIGPLHAGFLEPVVYCSPTPPRPLARRLDRMLADVPNVTQSRGGYGDGSPTAALPYRVAAGGEPSATWRHVLEVSKDARLGRTSREVLGSALLVALWHGRYGNAAATLRETAKHDGLAEPIAAVHLRMLAAVCSTLARGGGVDSGYRVQRLLRLGRVATGISGAAKPW